MVIRLNHLGRTILGALCLVAASTAVLRGQYTPDGDYGAGVPGTPAADYVPDGDYGRRSDFVPNGAYAANGHYVPEGNCGPNGRCGSNGYGGANGYCGPDGLGYAGVPIGYCPHGPAEEVCGGTTLYWTGPCSNWRPPFCRYTAHYLAGSRPIQAAVPALWYASAELVPLYRDQDNSLAFQSLGASGQNIALGTGDFETDFAAGGKVVVGVALTEDYRLEGSWLGGHTWEDRAVISNFSPNNQGTTGLLYSPYSNFGIPPVLGLDFNQQASIEMRSELHSGELNLRKRLLLPPGPFEVNALVGARWMTIDESFHYLSDSAIGGGISNDINTLASNDLIGLQLGLQGQFLTTNCSWFDLDVKGALCNNSAEQSTTWIATDTGGATALTGGYDKDVTSFIGEVALSFNYQLLRNTTLRAGYQALWVTGLALADENAIQPLNSLTVGPALLEHEGDVVYHGPNFGLVFTR